MVGDFKESFLKEVVSKLYLHKMKLDVELQAEEEIRKKINQDKVHQRGEAAGEMMTSLYVPLGFCSGFCPVLPKGHHCSMVTVLPFFWGSESWQAETMLCSH